MTAHEKASAGEELKDDATMAPETSATVRPAWTETVRQFYAEKKRQSDAVQQYLEHLKKTLKKGA